MVNNFFSIFCSFKKYTFKLSRILCYGQMGEKLLRGMCAIYSDTLYIFLIPYFRQKIYIIEEIKQFFTDKKLISDKDLKLVCEKQKASFAFINSVAKFLLISRNNENYSIKSLLYYSLYCKIHTL